MDRNQQERPGIRVVYDHLFKDNRAWFRFAFKWLDPKTDEARSRAGMQSYRIEVGKLVETWLPLSSTWTDMPQERWTSSLPLKLNSITYQPGAPEGSCEPG